MNNLSNTIYTTEICNSIGRIYRHSIMWMYADESNQYDADGNAVLYNDEDEHNGITVPVLVEYNRNAPIIVEFLNSNNLPSIELEKTE